MTEKQPSLLLSVSAMIAIAVVFLLTGCQTTPKVASSTETREDLEEVFSTVAGALSGKKLNEEEIRNLEEQIKTDEEAQSAIQSITDSVGGIAPVVKYCPVTGKRYAAHFESCPQHHVPLEIVSP